MNKLSRETRSLILKMLCEGQSMRSTGRLVDNTVAKLLVDASRACSPPGCRAGNFSTFAPTLSTLCVASKEGAR